jgi:hypothetical protein
VLAGPVKAKNLHSSANGSTKSSSSELQQVAGASQLKDWVGDTTPTDLR